MTRSMIAGWCVVAVLAIASEAQAVTVYQTGFEPSTYSATSGTPAGALGGQDGWEVVWGPDKFTVQTAIYEGSQAVKARTNSSARDARMLDSVFSVGPTDILTLSYDQYLPAAWFTPFSQGSRALTVTLRPYYTDPEWNDPYYHIVLSTWGQYSGGYMQRIGFGVGDSQLAVEFEQSVLADKWSNLRIVVNNGTGSAEAFLNNVYLGMVSFTPGGPTSIESVELDASSPSYVNAYIDNIEVSIVPEPATLALLGLGLGVLACRGRKTK